MNYLQNWYNISRHSFKKLCCTAIWNIKVKNVAIALPILDDKAVPNFYYNFVSTVVNRFASPIFR